VRQTIYDLRRDRPGTRAAIHLSAWLSAAADSIIYNSQVARQQHEAIGYNPTRATVIPNGFDSQVFRPRPEAAARLRAELGLPAECLVVGMVSRYHPMKGHEVFFAAARRLLDRGVNAAFVCVGRDVVPGNVRLAEPIARLGLTMRVHLLGERYDTPELFSGFDLYCSPSRWGEGFPNAVGEALASGTPCVVTNVGDSASVAGPGGLVVPADNAAALADAMLTELQETAEARRTRGARGREHMEHHFSIARMGERYAALYRGLAGS
jgi:glycosyltransferase involved in cell wall biosynthesis